MQPKLVLHYVSLEIRSSYQVASRWEFVKGSAAVLPAGAKCRRQSNTPLHWLHGASLGLLIKCYWSAFAALSHCCCSKNRRVRKMQKRWLWFLWHLLVNHSANECGIPANAHYCLLSPCLTLKNEKSMSWILYKDWVDHYVKGHLTNSPLLPIMANRLHKCSNSLPRTPLELAGFATEAASRQTAVNRRSVTLQPARVINERSWWNMTKRARRLRGRRRDFLYRAWSCRGPGSAPASHKMVIAG